MAMSNVALFPSRGFIVELERTPPAMPQELEENGVALIAARTVEGLYIEPARSLSAVLAAFDRAGAVVRTVRATTRSETWERAPRPPRYQRPGTALRDPRSACWLPTLPAA